MEFVYLGAGYMGLDKDLKAYPVLFKSLSLLYTGKEMIYLTWRIEVTDSSISKKKIRVEGWASGKPSRNELLLGGSGPYIDLWAVYMTASIFWTRDALL